MSLTVEKVKTMLVADLRKALTDRDLSIKGVKTALIKRLTASIEAEVEEEDDVMDDAPEEVEAEAEAEVEAEAEAEDAEPAKPISTLAGLLEKIAAKSEDELTDSDKDVLQRKKRAEKFGQEFKLNDGEMSALRRARFGVQTAKGKRGKVEHSTEELEKMSKRSKRFGGVTTQSGMTDPEEQAKMDARAKRFE